jgi:hypothetical protein
MINIIRVVIVAIISIPVNTAAIERYVQMITEQRCVLQQA